MDMDTNSLLTNGGVPLGPLLIVDLADCGVHLRNSCQTMDVFCVRLLREHVVAYLDEVENPPPSGVILSGGSKSIYARAFEPPKVVYELGVPLLATSHAAHHLVRALGGKVLREGSRKGNQPVLFHRDKAVDLLCGLEETEEVWMDHKDTTKVGYGRNRMLPRELLLIAQTIDDREVAAYKHVSKPWFGVQFRPEHDEMYRRKLVDDGHGGKHIVDVMGPGQIIIRNFARICGFKAEFRRDRLPAVHDSEAFPV